MQVFSYNLTPFRSHSYRLAIPDRAPTTDWTQAYGAQVGRFLGYLVNTGYIGPLEPVREPTLPDPLEKFRTWLECHRGITARSIHRYIRHIAAILPGLGDEPRAYDAALVRRTLFRHIEHRSRHYAKRLTGAMRMYLRFLVAEALASALGIDTARLARLTFIFGVGTAGLAGVLLAPLVRIEPYMGLDYLLSSFFILVVGGLGTLEGLLIGSSVIAGTDTIASALFDKTAGYMTVLALSILFLWLRPHGLYGRR